MTCLRREVIFRKRTDGLLIIPYKLSCDNYGSLTLINNKVSFLSRFVLISVNILKAVSILMKKAIKEQEE